MKRYFTRKLAAFLPAVFALFLAGGAAAAVIQATEVLDATPGVIDASLESDRYVASNALGATDDRFYSLGLGGVLTLGFDRTISGPSEIRVTEVTFPFVNLARYREAVDVFAVLGNSRTLVGRLANFEALGGAVLTFDGPFDALQFVDVTRIAYQNSPSADGFDIDSVQVTSSPMPVSLPASGAALLVGIGIGALAHRRRRQA